jgi:hypothetical protein
LATLISPMMTLAAMAVFRKGVFGSSSVSFFYKNFGHTLKMTRKPLSHGILYGGAGSRTPDTADMSRML